MWTIIQYRNYINTKGVIEQVIALTKTIVKANKIDYFDKALQGKESKDGLRK